MTIVQTNQPLPALKRFSAKPSQYDFGTLTPGSDQAIIEFDVVNPKKVSGRLTSAVTAYRKRTKSETRFTVRSFKTDDGKDAVGVWALAAVAAPAA